MENDQWQKILGKELERPQEPLMIQICAWCFVSSFILPNSHLSQDDFPGITAVFEHGLENLDFLRVQDVRLVEDLWGSLNISSLQIPYTKQHISIYFLLNICKIVIDKATWEDGKSHLEFWSPFHISMSFRCNAVNLGRDLQKKKALLQRAEQLPSDTTWNGQKSLAWNTKAHGRQNIWQMYVKMASWTNKFLKVIYFF